MRTRTVFYVVTCLFFTVSLMVGCAKTKPLAGAWVGEGISFFVSEDGTALTTDGSDLRENCSLLIRVDVDTNRLGLASTNQFLYEDVPIKGGEFEYISDTLTITGTFASPTEASGTYRYVDEVQDFSSGVVPRSVNVQGSGTWEVSRSTQD